MNICADISVCTYIHNGGKEMKRKIYDLTIQVDHYFYMDEKVNGWKNCKRKIKAVIRYCRKSGIPTDFMIIQYNKAGSLFPKMMDKIPSTAQLNDDRKKCRLIIYGTKYANLSEKFAQALNDFAEVLFIQFCSEKNGKRDINAIVNKNAIRKTLKDLNSEIGMMSENEKYTVIHV